MAPNSNLFLVQYLQASVGQLKIKKDFTIQHDKDPNHKHKSTKEWLQKINVLELARSNSYQKPGKLREEGCAQEITLHFQSLEE